MSAHEGKPEIFRAEAPIEPGSLELSPESLRAIEQQLFVNPRNESAIRHLAYFVRVMGDRLFAAESELDKIRRGNAVSRLGR
jgi:hypothetical protein